MPVTPWGNLAQLPHENGGAGGRVEQVPLIAPSPRTSDGRGRGAALCHDVDLGGAGPVLGWHGGSGLPAEGTSAGTGRLRQRNDDDGPRVE